MPLSLVAKLKSESSDNPTEELASGRRFLRFARIASDLVVPVCFGGVDILTFVNVEQRHSLANMMELAWDLLKVVEERRFSLLTNCFVCTES